MTDTVDPGHRSAGGNDRSGTDVHRQLSGGARLQQQLGLAVDPFAEGALPDFYFVGGQRRYLVQQCVHQLYFGAPMVLLIGAWGAGKSRLLAEVRKELTGLADLCLTAATVMTDAAALRQEIALAAGLPAGAAYSTETLLASLDRVRPRDAQPQPVLLLLDDAHLLAPVELAACCELIQGAQGRIRALLAAEVSLFASWPPQLRAADGLVARLDLDPLDPDESVDYLRTRLQAAGLRQPLPLDGAAQKQLFKDSRGNLAAIHEAGLRLLASGVDPAFAAPSEARARRRLAGGAVGRYLGTKRGLVAAGVALVAVTLAIILQTDDEGEPSATVATAALPARARGDEAGRKRVPLVLEWGSDSSAGEAPVAVSAAGSASTPSPAYSAAGRGPLDADAERSAAPVAEADPAGNPPEPAAPPAPSAPVVRPEEPATAAAVAEAVQPGRQSTPAASGTSVPVRGPTESDEQALLALDSAQSVMVQLMGARSLDDLRKSVVASGHRGRVYYVETQMGGKPWFVALIGPFERGAAAGAIAGLPAALRAAKPWPRPLTTVQADIRRQPGLR